VTLRPLRRAAVALVLVFAACAVEGTVVLVHEERVPSRFTRSPVRAAVLTPPSYETSPARRYPVLYFLHGGGENEKTFVRRGIAELLLADMRAGRIPELLVVSPRARGTWYVDSHDGRDKYASFLGKELVPYVDARYRTIAARHGRAATGISMGGYGAIHWGLLDPELFTVVSGVSPALQQLNWEMLTPLPFFIRWSFHSVFGKTERANSLRENDVYDMLLRDPTLAARAPAILVRCGAEDRYRLAQITQFFGRFLDALGIDGEVTIEPGAHDWRYWDRALPPLLRDTAARLAPKTEAG
jgi:S-formylglutathione hydrolase FrmB